MVSEAAAAAESNGGPGWARTSEGVKPADLQSAPFDHFGTDPRLKKVPLKERSGLPEFM